MKTIVVACDSFKGSLSSAEVCETVKRAILDVTPAFEIATFEVGDGGEGTAKSVQAYVKCKKMPVRSFDPFMREIDTDWIEIEKDGEPAALIELAKTAGLELLSQDELNPMETTTYGTGVAIKDALHKGHRNIIVALGGSATNDAGIGLLSALGAKFIGKDGQTLKPCGRSLISINSIDVSSLIGVDANFTLACDVNAPFCGEHGAAYMFARQKGASETEIEELDKGLHNFASIIHKQFDRDITKCSMSGAAGGTAGGMLALLGAKAMPGAEMILDMAGYDKAASNACLAITGEGSFDTQTATGKLPYAIALRNKRHGIPTILICGKNKTGIKESELYRKIIETCPNDMPLPVAMRKEQAKANISKAIKEHLHGFLAQNK